MRPRYKLDDVGVSTKTFVQFRDSVNFTWRTTFQCDPISDVVQVRVDSALCNDHCICLPNGWETSLHVLKLAVDAKGSATKCLPPNVSNLSCQLLGLPKVSQAGQQFPTPGACVALTVNGNRVNYVLVAHVYGDLWRCSPGAIMENGHILLDTVWRSEDCITKNIVTDVWSSFSPKRRVSSHIMTSHLMQLMRTYTKRFYDLVANQGWLVESDRTCTAKKTFDVNTATTHFEPNPFTWDMAVVHKHTVNICYIWSWECFGELKCAKVAIQTNPEISATVPLPDLLHDDLALFERLVQKAQRETDRLYCTCVYLGMQIGANVFEPDPTKWHVQWNINQRIWLEYKYVYNAETNKRHRVQVYINNWLAHTDRSPGHPLYTTSSRSLRFSLEFMDSFAQNCMKGMTFLGVSYDNADRPEIIRHLPNAIDIQNEHGVTATVCCHFNCHVCLSDVSTRNLLGCILFLCWLHRNFGGNFHRAKLFPNHSSNFATESLIC